MACAAEGGDSSPVILITGAARRVGAEIARALHAAGARVAIHYRTAADEAQMLAAALNGERADSAAGFAANLLELDALPKLVAQVVDRFGRLDGLVNNASSFYPTKVGATNTAAWDDLVGTNLKAPLFLTQAAAPQLKMHHGCVVNITDVHAERPLQGYAVYCAAKAGLLGLTRALAVELGPQVRVNAVAPGAVIWPEQTDDFPPAERDAIIEHTLLKRVGSAADIARAVRFLVFDAPYVTGQTITVDGGRSAHL